MIPTREQIDAYSKSDFASVKVERWLRDMYAELQFYASACSDRDGYCAQVRKLRDAIIAIGVAVGAYFGLKPLIGAAEVGWVCMLAAFPFAMCGFFTYNGMPAERFLR